MRKVVIALVLLVVGISCFASTKSVSVFNSNNKLLLTTKEDSDTKSVSFYDSDGEYIEVDLVGDAFFVFVGDGDDERSIMIIEGDETTPWDKYTRVSREELTDDDGNVVGYGLGLLTKEDGYLYVVLIYKD